MIPKHVADVASLTAHMEAAKQLTASRLMMARAASDIASRDEMSKIYDDLWTLACRVSRALAYKGKHARRMRQRLAEPKPFAQVILEQAERPPLGEPVPTKPKRKSKREQAKTGFADDDDIRTALRYMQESLDRLTSDTAKEPVRQRMEELQSMLSPTPAK